MLRHSIDPSLHGAYLFGCVITFGLASMPSITNNFNNSQNHPRLARITGVVAMYVLNVKI